MHLSDIRASLEHSDLNTKLKFFNASKDHLCAPIHALTPYLSQTHQQLHIKCLFATFFPYPCPNSGARFANLKK